VCSCSDDGTAALSATAAFFRAAAHHVVVELFARLGAVLAGSGADTAGVSVKLRAAQHEVVAELTRLRALTESANVIGGRIVASFSEAMDDRRDADLVTRRAPIDALAQIVGEVLGHTVVGHVGPSVDAVRAFHRMAKGPDPISNPTIGFECGAPSACRCPLWMKPAGSQAKSRGE
jgi:hypothetical protein